RPPGRSCTRSGCSSAWPHGWPGSVGRSACWRSGWPPIATSRRSDGRRGD
ncbi:MAG: hypothetical protein AVDCRST_MAG57-560, partial [uncultured Blastococcus sp.]